MKRIVLSNEDFKTLNSGKHVCVNGIHKFISVLVENKETSEEIKCRVQQVGGIFNYSASIIKE